MICLQRIADRNKIRTEESNIQAITLSNCAFLSCLTPWRISLRKHKPNPVYYSFQF